MAHTDDPPDEKSVMTYVSSLYEIFPKEPTAQETLHDNVSNIDVTKGTAQYFLKIMLLIRSCKCTIHEGPWVGKGSGREI